MLLSCGNVELRGFEPLTSCMPCLAVSSDGIALGRITAGQTDIGVWVRRAVSAVAWGRCHLICHWLQDLSLRNTGSLVLPNPGCGQDHSATTGDSGAGTGIGERPLPLPVKVRCYGDVRDQHGGGAIGRRPGGGVAIMSRRGRGRGRPLRQGWCHLVPHHVGLGIAVQHQDRRPRPGHPPADTVAVDIDVDRVKPVQQSGHCHPPIRSMRTAGRPESGPSLVGRRRQGPPRASRPM